MEIMDWIIFLTAVVFSSYVQAVTGFGMGILLMAIIGACHIVSLPVLAAVVSLVSGINVWFSLRGNLHFVQKRLLFFLVLGQLPAVGVGVWLGNRLDRDAVWLLELMLGIFITISSCAMLLRSKSSATVSGAFPAVGAGFAGGIIGGLFAASGPVISLFMYRQPIRMAVIRATLLSFFAIAILSRTAIVAHQGGLTSVVWNMVFVGLPLTLFGAWLGRVGPPPVSEDRLKHLVFVTLFFVGLYIIVTATYFGN